MKLVMHWLQHYRKMQSRYRRSQSYRVPWDLWVTLCRCRRKRNILETKAELEARLVTYMGGRAAEEIMCDSVTTGASNDIEMATRIARAMVTQFGMSEEFGLMGVESVENRYLDGRAVTNCGDETIAKVDEVVKVMLQKAYDTAKEMLLTHRDVLERIAGYLYEHETITGKEFMDIFNEMDRSETANRCRRGRCYRTDRGADC